MKGIGVVRKLDELGRITLPMEIRRTFDINIGDGVEIFVEEDSIIFKKYQTHCAICGEANNVASFKNKKFCINCINELKKL